MDISENTLNAVSFPIEAIPEEIRKPIEAIAEIGQLAVEISAQSVLSAISLATQHINTVTMGNHGACPVSSYFLTIAESGAGKTTADRYAMHAINEYVGELEEAYERLKLQYDLENRIFTQRCSQIGRESAHLTSTESAALISRVTKPLCPPIPEMITNSCTYSGLFELLREGPLSIGLFNDDSSGIIKGVLRQPNMLALLTNLWSGTPVRRRTNNKSISTKGRRLSAHLMVQPGHADQLLFGEHADEQGIIPRFLISAASVRKKTFRHGDVSAHQESLSAYDARIDALVRSAKAEADVAPLRPSANALNLFYNFCDEVEEIGDAGGEFSLIRSSLRRSPECAARLAAMMAIFLRGRGVRQVKEGEMAAGIALMRYYNHQKFDLYREHHVDPIAEMAEAAYSWMCNRCSNQLISQREFCYRGIPAKARNASKAELVLGYLERNGRLERLEGKQVVNGQMREKVWRIIPSYQVMTVAAE